MGPRRVGKTVLVFHLIRHLLKTAKFKPSNVIYVDLQQPLYNGLGLERLLKLAIEASNSKSGERVFVCFDEVQYLRNWEVHLKALVDSFPMARFVATGSAAAALKLKSAESGAGRFTDFLLPPLTFFEYLDLTQNSNLVSVSDSGPGTPRKFTSPDISELNSAFVEYLNHGGYPEALFSKDIRADPGRYIRSDIIDKVLLKDLPSLYGIQDVQELNSLFTTLAYNTANEVSLAQLSQNSGVAKNTLKRYIDYLQAAFLIRVVHRLDRTSKRFQRATHFKVYLTNPSMRSALFSPLSADDDQMGGMVETAVFSQWFHSTTAELYYARWNDGEVDMVHLSRELTPSWAVEVKWSDRCVKDSEVLASLKSFSELHPDCEFIMTSKTIETTKRMNSHTVDIIPASLYCYILGFNILNRQSQAQLKPSARVWRHSDRS